MVSKSQTAKPDANRQLPHSATSKGMKPMPANPPTTRPKWRTLRSRLSWNQWGRRNWSTWQSLREHEMPHQWWIYS